MDVRRTANISGTSPTSVTFDASDVFQAEDSLTAFATGGQTSATAMSATKSYHRFSTVVTAGDSGKLPAATVGQAHFVRNDGAAAMQVFGQSTETINGVASATGVSQHKATGVWYICTTAGAWTSSPTYNPAAVAITGGTIDGTVIGGVTPAAVTGTTVGGTTITATTKFVVPDGTSAAPSIAAASALTNGLYYSTAKGGWIFSGNNPNVLVNNSQLIVASGGGLAWNSGTDVTSGSPDTILVRDGAANTLAQKNSTSEQIFRRYGANGGYEEWGSASELLTLSTGGATTDTAANLLPANSYIESVTARITTTITVATNWKLGDATTAGRFTAANSTLTLGTTDVGLVHIDVVGAGGPRQTAAAKVRVTTTGTPGAGVVRITVHYRTYVPPTS